MPLISALTCPRVALRFSNKLRKLLGALCVLALPMTMQAQTLSFAGLQTTLTAMNAAPVAIAIDASGNRYILNHGASNITEVSAAGVQSTITVALTHPSAIAVDTSGNLYIADTSAAYIIKVPAGGGTATHLGSGFSQPAGLAVDNAGNVYVADSAHGLVKKIPAVGTTITNIPGTYTNPVGLALAGSNLYISDIGSEKLFEVPIIGTAPTVTTLQGNLPNQPYDVSADTQGNYFLSGGTDHKLTMYSANGLIRQLGTSVTQPEGIALDGTGNVYVADQSTPAIDIIAPGSVNLGQANLCPSSGTPAPCSQSVTLNFNVASSASLTSVTTRVVTQGVASADFTSTSSNTCTGSLSATCSVTVNFKPLAPGIRLGAVDVSGKVGSAPTPSLLATVPLYGVGLGPLAGFNAGIINTVPWSVGNAPAPSTVISDSLGDLYFIDHGSCLVDKFNNSTQTTSTIAGSVCGTAAGSGGPATTAVFQDPYRLALNGRGDLYISDDQSNVIWKVDAVTQIITQVAGIAGTPGYSVNVAAQGNSIGYPYALALDGAGDLYFSDFSVHIVQKIDANTGVLTTVAGVHTDPAGYGGDGGPATAAQLNNPIGLAVDAAGNFYIDDAGNEIIRKVTASTGIITTVAGTQGTTPGYSGDGGLATSAMLADPEGIAVDAAGNLYIADTNNYVVRKVNASTGFISTLIGTATGSAQYSGDAGAANLAGLSDVSDVAVDSAGVIYVADNANNAIRAVTPASGIATFATYNMGTSSPAIDVVVTNYGNQPLDLSALTAPTSFNLDGADTTCTASTTLPVGAECVLGVEFLPTSVGALTGSLTLTDNVGNDPTSTQALALNGTGAYVPTQVVLTGVPATITAGGNLGTVSATIESSGNNVVTNSTAAVTATVTGPGSYSATVTADAVGGVASLSLSNLVLSNPGTYTVTAASAGLTSGVESTTAVAPPHLVLSTLPASISAGGNLGIATVSIEDSNGAVITSASASVVLAITGPANYSRTLAVVAVSGVATFNLTSIPFASTGTYTVTATSPGDTSANTFVTVVPPPATQLALSGIPSSIFAGGNLGTPTVSIESANGSVVTTTSASVTLTITGPASYSHTLTVAARSGVATFSLTSLTLTNPGTYTATATSTGLAAATATSTVIVPPATQLAVSGLPTTIAAGGNLGMVTATIKDASGTIVSTSAPVTITITGPGSYSQIVTQAAVNGVATLDLSSFRLATAGTYTAVTTSAGLPSVTSTVTVTFTLTSAQPSATISAGGAATYTISLPATTSTIAQPLTFTATGLPSGATATFSPATVTPGPAAVSTTLTIQTAATTAALHTLPGYLQRFAGIAMGLLLLPFAASRRLRRAAAQMPMLSVVFGLLSAGAIFGLTGCGGGSSQPVTPTPQTYAITVTGTSGGASGSTTVTLIVQ